MAKKIQKQQEFIELRAGGLSFDEIAKRVNISKPTLIKWSKEYKDKIDEVTQIVEEQFLSEQRIKNIARAQRMSDELDRAYEALQKTDYENMKKKDLINIIKILEEKLELKYPKEDLNNTQNYDIQIRRNLIGWPIDLPDVPDGSKARSEDETPGVRD